VLQTASSCSVALFLLGFALQGNVDTVRNALYVDAYLQYHIDNGYSPYTQKAITSALAKLFVCSTKDFIPTQTRHSVTNFSCIGA